MVNSWSLLYDEMYGPDDEERDVKNKKENETKSEYWFDYNRNDPNRSDPFKESISFEGPADWSKNEESWESIEEPLNINFPIPGNAAADTIAFTGSHLPGAMGQDHIDFGGDLDFSSVTGVDDVYEYHFPGTEQDKPKPDLKNASNQKYKEDKGIADLKSYVASTYQGHYTNKNSDVQTLDLIHSVGDAESFCRSNAIKYLSRYDKKGSAKNDILKAMHYCLLLYYFSGNTQEPDYTNARYETF